MGRRVPARALGWFLELRLIPVLLWSYTAVALGTALAFAETGAFDLVGFAVALALGVLIQGWVTHAINEIYDWRSGTDRDQTRRALSGGSKVLNLGLLGERDLWVVFAVSTAATAVLATYAAVARAAWLVAFAVAGYGIGVAYTVPPVATSYRPYLGEWLGGFPGVLLAGLGAYAIQTLRVSSAAILVVSAHALVCLGMLTMHHYLDAPADARATPMKRTTVVALGPARAKRYATGLALAAAFLYAIGAVLVHPALGFGAAMTLLAAFYHMRVDPADLRSVTRNELRVIQLGVGAGLGSVAGLAPILWPILPVAAAGYMVHLLAVAPPAALGRAWRRAPASADRGDEP